MILDNENPDKSLRIINILHIVSFILQLGFLLTVIYIAKNKETLLITNQETIIYTQYLFVFLVMGSIPLSEYYLKQKLKKALEIQDKNERMGFYFTAVIMKLALIEFIDIMAIVIILLTGQKSFIYISVILLLFFLLSKPAKEKIRNDLNLDEQNDKI